MDDQGRQDAEEASALDEARGEIRAAFENRALMYYYIFRELAGELGREPAADLMKRAIRRRGLEVGEKYRAAGQEGDLASVAAIFCEKSAAGGELFEPGVEALEEDRLVLRMEGCPLVDAWRSLGLPRDEVDLMCEIAAAVDEGTFEAAGLDLVVKDRLGIPGSTRCLLELRPKARQS